jgi:hypothetical protein
MLRDGTDGHEEPNFHICNVVLFILHVLLQTFKGAQFAIMDAKQVCFDL